MIFGGIQKTSLIDYPGKISCILFTAGCNFSCPYCHNPELARNRKDRLTSVTEDDVIEFLKRRKGLLDGVVVTGGEPTLHGDLGRFCEKVKKLGYPVKLDTNGSRPKELANLLSESLVDYIAMDVKTGPFQYTPCIHGTDVSRNVVSCIEVILNSDLPHEFRTTCLAPFVDARTIARIAKVIEGADLYVLQQFKNGAVLDPNFISKKASRYSDQNLLDFQSIAAPSVERCVVR